jgi:cytochrome c oxidase subunit II
MRRLRIAFLGLAALWALFFQPGLSEAYAQNRIVEITMTARKYAFDPKRITVKQGDHVRLLITDVDHRHGFQIEGYPVNQLIKKGSTVVIEFTADKTGTYHFRCSHFCGLGHSKMGGSLVVER